MAEIPRAVLKTLTRLSAENARLKLAARQSRKRQRALKRQNDLLSRKLHDAEFAPGTPYEALYIEYVRLSALYSAMNAQRDRELYGDDSPYAKSILTPAFELHTADA